MVKIKGKEICPHCKADLRIRNPKGWCDHLNYPEYCNKCQKIEYGNPPNPAPESNRKKEAILIKDLEDLEQHAYLSLAWSDKHDKDELLGALANHITEIINKYFKRKYYKL